MSLMILGSTKGEKSDKNPPCPYVYVFYMNTNIRHTAFHKTTCPIKILFATMSKRWLSCSSFGFTWALQCSPVFFIRSSARTCTPSTFPFISSSSIRKPWNKTPKITTHQLCVLHFEYINSINSNCCEKKIKK